MWVAGPSPAKSDSVNSRVSGVAATETTLLQLGSRVTTRVDDSAVLDSSAANAAFEWERVTGRLAEGAQHSPSGWLPAGSPPGGGLWPTAAWAPAILAYRPVAEKCW